ncbi:predicted protein [Arabidopsis lyrata subsp. lyrata]|uniref:Predicted protein n=1 Tax=Arabidopsis lyrata subsp. lyrata TaxID=81972 RepID=D7LW36_ARALL|nr:predicted protein [Arabidopsis lyrata subsp. lyrata]
MGPKKVTNRGGRKKKKDSEEPEFLGTINPPQPDHNLQHNQRLEGVQPLEEQDQHPSEEQPVEAQPLEEQDQHPSEEQPVEAQPSEEQAQHPLEEQPVEDQPGVNDGTDEHDHVIYIYISIYYI